MRNVFERYPSRLSSPNKHFHLMTASSAKTTALLTLSFRTQVVHGLVKFTVEELELTLKISIFALRRKYCSIQGNVVVTLLAVISIGGILADVLALINLYGWSLGDIESSGVVIAIGFGFDYIAHVCTAYLEQNRSPNRMDRTRATLTELGISVCRCDYDNSCRFHALSRA